MRITFLLPGCGPKPIGGYKVVYEYANELVARGHDVAVAHTAFLPDGGASRSRIRVLRHQVLSYFIKGSLQLWRPDRWFKMDPRVRMLWIPSLRPEFIPDADAIVATWWLTAEILAAWPKEKGRKYYLIQHLETWGGPEERVLATWRLPLTKIVIARWLEDIVLQLGERCQYIPNGLNFAAFGIDRRPADRPPASVAMLYHLQDWKGSSDGIAALRLAKASLPELRVELFGVSSAPEELPDWITYHKNPLQAQLRAIYNRAAIFLSPSWSEGWPLPPAEAMACGCALVCTEIGGHDEYASHGVTALMNPRKNTAGLAQSIVRLASDTELRLRLATQGNRSIQQYTWQRAADSLETALAAAPVRVQPATELEPFTV